jgi:hypothetical protein
MLGHRGVVIHFALILLMSRGVLPGGWVPAAHESVPLTACGVIQAADEDDGYTGDGTAIPGNQNSPPAENCAVDISPGIAAPDRIIFFDPVLQDDSDLEDDDTTPVHHMHPAPAFPIQGDPSLPV